MKKKAKKPSKYDATKKQRKLVAQVIEDTRNANFYYKISKDFCPLEHMPPEKYWYDMGFLDAMHHARANGVTK